MPDNNIVIRKERFGGIIGDRNGYGFHPINNAAFRLLSKLAHDRSPIHSDDHPEFVTTLRDLGFLNNEGMFAGEFIDNANDVPFMSAPIRVWLEVTSKCNLHCRECFNELHPHLKSDLPLAKLLEILTELNRAGVLQITITGGEPLIRKDIWQILDECFALGFGVRFFTNATALNDENSERLSHYAFSHVFASVDGMGDLNDRLRGEGTFGRISQGITRLAAKISNVTLSVTLHRHSISRLGEIFEFAKANGVRSLLIRPLFQYTQAETDPLSIPRSSLPDLRRRLEFASTKHGVEYQLNKLPFVEQRKAVYFYDNPADIHASAFTEHNQFGCVGGNTVVGIKSSGTIVACGFVPTQYQSINNSVVEAPFLDLWNNAENVKVLRDITPNPTCAKCGLLSVCGGGCRANALLSTGRIDGVDPYCFWPDTEGIAPLAPNYGADLSITDERPHISPRRIITKCGSGSAL